MPDMQPRYVESWQAEYTDAAARNLDLLHVLSTMLLEGAKMTKHDCPSCVRVRADLARRGLLQEKAE